MSCLSPRSDAAEWFRSRSLLRLRLAVTLPSCCWAPPTRTRGGARGAGSTLTHHPTRQTAISIQHTLEHPRTCSKARTPRASSVTRCSIDTRAQRIPYGCTASCATGVIGSAGPNTLADDGCKCAGRAKTCYTCNNIYRIRPNKDISLASPPPPCRRTGVNKPQPSPVSICPEIQGPTIPVFYHTACP